MISNEKITKCEKEWLEAMLSYKFDYKNIIIYQINQANIKRDYTEYFFRILFDVPSVLSPIPIKTRVPIEMRVHREKKAPIQFLLHIMDGFVSELEIFNADSSPMDREIKITKKQIIIDPILTNDI